jgi:hypothetical protein
MGSMGSELAACAEVCRKTHEDRIMAIGVDEGGHRPEPGLGLALLTVLGMVLTTAVLAGLIYLLMLGVTATSSGKPTSNAAPVTPVAQPSQQPAASSPILPPPK